MTQVMGKRRTILHQMGIQEWRSQDAILNAIPDNAPGKVLTAEQISTSSDFSEQQLSGDTAASMSDPALVVTREVIERKTITQETVSQETGPQANSNQSKLSGSLEPLTPNKNPLSDLSLSGLQEWVNKSAGCVSCNANNSLLGLGHAQADWMFVVDAPNSRELKAQQFFVGRAGQLFESVLQALGLSRENVYTSSVFKCAPTEDLNLSPTCDNVLQRQIELVAPKVIVAFGEFSAQALIKANDSIHVLRQSKQRCVSSGSLVVPTFSPAQMLNDASLKADVWQDMKKAIRYAQNSL